MMSYLYPAPGYNPRQVGLQPASNTGTQLCWRDCYITTRGKILDLIVAKPN
jgi:hypothetical protein